VSRRRRPVDRRGQQPHAIVDRRFGELFHHAACEPEFRDEMDRFRAEMVTLAHLSSPARSPTAPGRVGR
jgi:hypothetical protein